MWYSESGVSPNTIVRFDPKTETFDTRPVPSGGGVIRHMVATPKGELYIACSGVNKVGIVRVGQISESTRLIYFSGFNTASFLCKMEND